MKLSYFRLLLSPDPVDGAPVVEPPAAPVGDAPPAATVVANGEITEEVVKLRKKTAMLEEDKKKVETRAAELEDENRQLRQVGLKAAAAPVVDKRTALERFMDGEDV